MDALVMAGGRGERLGRGEKPLLEIDGVPMIDRVLRALSTEAIDDRIVVTSPHTPNTQNHVDVPTIRTPGDGYIADLDVALDRVRGPVLTVTADIPLLTAPLVDRVVRPVDGESVSVWVPESLPRRLGVTVDRTRTIDHVTIVPTGINVVASGEQSRTHIMTDPRFAVNVNRSRDAYVAEMLS